MTVAAKFRSAALLAVVASVGCAASERSASYERVAKEWSKAIRASQVIPTYPLTQDLQPGDMFIVDLPANTEQELWDDRGYLPLGYHFGRLAMKQDDYVDFYDNDFGMVRNGRRPPAVYRIIPTPVGNAAAGESGWTAVAPVEPGTAAGRATPDATNPRVPATQPTTLPNAVPLEQRTSRQNWDLSPFASFPSYSVDITRQGGFNIGLPVQGVPIALGFMGSNRATATISLKEAYTFGLDNERVWQTVQNAYAVPAEPTMSERLKAFRPRYARNSDGELAVRYRFLRVITRVYLVGAVDVSVNDAGSFAGDLGFGQSGLKSNLALLSAFKDKGQTYDQLLSALNNGLAGQAATTQATSQPAQDSTSQTTIPPAAADSGIGARVKVLGVSEKSITLRESFPKPLVVGYLAIDIPIGVDGRLSGLRADTFKRLSSMRRRDLVNVGEDIQEWCELRPDSFNTIEDWGDVNAKWLFACGFQEFAYRDPQTGRYHYKSGSLQFHFAQGKIHRFINSVRHPIRYVFTPWRALYERLGNEIIYAPDGVLSELIPTSKDLAIQSQQAPPEGTPERGQWEKDRWNRETFGYRTDHLRLFRSLAPVLDAQPASDPQSGQP